MKKLVFTALTVVAFCGAVMAGTREVKGEMIDKKAEEVVSPSCDQEQKEAEQDALANGASKFEAYFAGAAAWGDCMKTLSFN